MNERTVVECKSSENGAAIGCGSLIIIAIMIFWVGRWSNNAMHEDVTALREQVTELQSQVQDLREEVRTVITITE